MPFADAKQRFSNRVADYVRYRPGYTAALLDLLRVECGLRSQHVVADIGSGTGLLSKLFLENGNRVFGVEPNPEMRQAGEEFLRSFPEFISVTGSAEATTLCDSSIDFITVGQAFHWFDPQAARREFLRILKPGGWAVIAWHDRRMEEAPLTREYEGLLERFGIDYKRVKDSYPESEDIRSFFVASDFSSRDLPNHQTLDWEGFRGRLHSSSFAPTESHPNYAPMMAELERIFHAHQKDGNVRMEYFTRVYFGRLEPR
ncbi:MAG TPA: class I SAM-dependent methyltransferase [Candidatus Acidoferrum sp.]|nr:class I SAM-dependent methyltransferase [Candidatus Acidoferrum sp.]